MRTRMLVVVALLFVPTVARAGGHRAEVAALYSVVGGSRLDGGGLSTSFPICSGPFWNPTADCAEDWSGVLAFSRLTGDLQENGTDLDAHVRVVLGGVRYTPTTWEKLRLVPLIQGLVGAVGIKDTKPPTPARFGSRAWGLAVGGSLGVEFKFPGDVVRLRIQGDGLLYQLGDRSRFGGGVTTALSFGFPHHP